MSITTLCIYFIIGYWLYGSAVHDDCSARNPVHSILWLIVVFFAISGHYILLNAQFLAIVNIIVYAGAIMVLFLFVVMLMNLNADTEPVKNYWLAIDRRYFRRIFVACDCCGINENGYGTTGANEGMGMTG